MLLIHMKIKCRRQTHFHRPIGDLPVQNLDLKSYYRAVMNDKNLETYRECIVKVFVNLCILHRRFLDIVDMIMVVLS